MNDLKIYRWGGACGLAAIILFLVEFPIYFLRGPVPLLADTNKLSDYIAKNTGNVLTVVLLHVLIYCGFLVFLAGFRYLIRQARPEYEWLSTLVFGVGPVYTTLTDPNGFYNPAGWGPFGVVAGFPLGAWAVIISIMMLRKRETLVSMPVRFG